MSEERPRFDDLMQESLATHAPTEPLYSVGANVLTAFFGGVFAMAYLTSLNVRRMNRPTVERLIPWAIGLVWAGVSAWLIYTRLTDSGPEWLGQLRERGSIMRRLGNLISVGLFGVHWLMYKHHYRAQSVSGTESPNPWRPALTGVGVGLVVAIGLTLLVTAAIRV